MRCRRVQRLLPIYKDGGLPARTIEGIEKHLADCGHCRQEAGELDDALTVLRAVPKVRPSPEFKRAVIAAVRRESARRREGLLERVLVWRPVLATGLAAAVVLGAVAIWHHGLRTPGEAPMAESPAPEVFVADVPTETPPAPVALESPPPVEPRVHVVAERRPSRARPSRVISRAMASPVPASLAVSEEPEPESAEPAEEAPADESPVVFDILGVDVLVADIGLSDVSLSDDAGDGFMLASATDEVKPAPVEELVAPPELETDPTTL